VEQHAVPKIRAIGCDALPLARSLKPQSTAEQTCLQQSSSSRLGEEIARHLCKGRGEDTARFNSELAEFVRAANKTN
jgi:hypothetical protein